VNFAQLGIGQYLHNCYSDSRVVDTFINTKSHLEKGGVISNYVYIAIHVKRHLTIKGKKV